MSQHIGEILRGELKRQHLYRIGTTIERAGMKHETLKEHLAPKDRRRSLQNERVGYHSFASMKVPAGGAGYTIESYVYAMCCFNPWIALNDLMSRSIRRLMTKQCVGLPPGKRHPKQPPQQNSVRDELQDTGPPRDERLHDSVQERHKGTVVRGTPSPWDRRQRDAMASLLLQVTTLTRSMTVWSLNDLWERDCRDLRWVVWLHSHVFGNCATHAEESVKRESRVEGHAGAKQR